MRSKTHKAFLDLNNFINILVFKTRLQNLHQESIDF